MAFKVRWSQAGVSKTQWVSDLPVALEIAQNRWLEHGGVVEVLVVDQESQLLEARIHVVTGPKHHD